MKVEVETEIVDGDTTIVIEVNGEEIELGDLNKIEGGFKWTSKDGKAIVIELDDDGKDEDEIRIIKRKIIIEDED